MYLAIDDTDSRDGMCTTYLATEIILRSRLDLAGYPWLVRLNPNIKHKTRGNGAIVLQLGKGKGVKTPIGMSNGRSLYSFETVQESGDMEEEIERVSGIIEEFAVLSDENTNPGAVCSRDLLDTSLYREALTREVEKNSIRKVLDDRKVEYREFKNGRGIIGAASALGWRHLRATYEVMHYSYPNPEDYSHSIKMKAARALDRELPDTFNNIDEANSHASIFPANRTPVLYGVRSTSVESLKKAEMILERDFNIFGRRSLIFMTNQGTDDHILRSPASMWNGGSFSIEGEIFGHPSDIEGGHCFVNMKWNGTHVKLAAFEPTKEFRRVLKALRPGDRVNSTGSFSDGTLKLEKIEIDNLSRYFRRTQPVCDDCGVKMKTKGRHDFRCPKCKARKDTPQYEEEMRDLVPGKYEVPVCARRHLSMPLKLEPYFSAALSQEMQGANS